MRHIAASIALAAGDVPLIVVSRQLGHADPKVNAAVYSHLFSEDQLDAFARGHGRTGVRDGVRENVADA